MKKIMKILSITYLRSILNCQARNFIIFDIVEFYPSITAKPLDEALNYAAQYMDNSNEDRNILHYTKKSILITKGQPWSKKSSESFDVTMGSYDGAETCKLVGMFLLNIINNQ